MMTRLQNDRPDVTAPSLPVQQKTLFGSSAVVIVSDEGEQSKRRGEVLAAAYRYILGPEWGKA